MSNMNKKAIVLIVLVAVSTIFASIFVYVLEEQEFTQESINNSKLYTSALFDNYNNNDSIDKYLISTSHAEKDDDYIESLAKNITKNESTNLEKAEAIFDWVKNNIDYSRYSNTKYGGKNTIIYGIGNCVDTSHALVALLRASDIPARYVNGKCIFTKGELKCETVSHVWVQVLIDDKWMVADGIYDENKLGYVTNWDLNSHIVYGKYANL